MHIADGIMAVEVVVAADAAALGALYLAGRNLETSEVPKMGIMAAALFVASLIHFPIAGTSVHLGLFGLAGILLGLRAFPVIFCALLFQSLLFQHGGLLSLGLNAINMGAGALVAFFIWEISMLPEVPRAFLCGFLGILVPAVLMGLEFRLSGYGRGIFYLFSVYLLAAGIEGLLSASVVGFFRRIHSSILEKGNLS
jgi:cobalt/nickel transport system permease protein